MHNCTDEQHLRLECLKLSVINSSTHGIRNPIEVAEQYLAWCKTVSEKPAAKASVRARASKK